MKPVKNYIERAIEPILMEYLIPNKAILLIGARRVGKTELINHIATKVKGNPVMLYGESDETRDLLKEKTTANYKRLMGEESLLIIDEAQEVPDIGIKIKLMLDTIEGIKVIATGSSAFDLTNKMGEPLVGRKTTFHLHPFAQMEFSANENYLETKSKLKERLIFGSYPELEQIKSIHKKVDYLKEVVSSYLLKDILAFEGIKNREVILSLLRKIAFRVGSEISVEGLGNELGISKNTVDKYLELLSKVFIIHKVTGFSRNLDNEITKMNKWYFYDNGIRNALISNFNMPDLRDDIGALWENYLISERLKLLSYTRSYASHYFWRTHRKQEIDWVEEKDGQLFAHEIKWNTNKTPKPPSAWVKAYPKASFNVITPDNYLDFIII
ncbi:MAG: ATP-binding protein [Cyclobacteriaceae bacterium]|nr:ATP-binding protein [Cyclobacteriaceae bacterium]